jgi:quercetin dioxygenase-like cupin family protein
MNGTRLSFHAMFAAVAMLYVQAGFAQQAAPAAVVRTVLGVAALASVIDTPLFFKLSTVRLPAGQTTKYAGPVGFIYVLTGGVVVQSGVRQQSLQPDDAFLTEPSDTHSLTAGQSEAASFLHFVLARPNELQQAVEQPPASIAQIYQTPGAIPDLKPGHYEFTLTRASYPRMEPNPPHYRSGAALYYVLSGTGIFFADGKQETKKAGTAHFEPRGWVHQWGNNADEPLVLLQANISEEGAPAVIIGQP